MIDELRSFYDEGANFSLVLSGLPPLLSRTMSLSVNQPMKQRINLTIELEPMTLAQSMDYVKHQLGVSRARNPVFDDGCFPVIHSITSGVPRRINQLCYRALIQSYIDSRTIITGDCIKALADKSSNIFEKSTFIDAGTNNAQFKT